MKKFISVILIALMFTSIFSVNLSAFADNLSNIPTAEETTAPEEKETTVATEPSAAEPEVEPVKVTGVRLSRTHYTYKRMSKNGILQLTAIVAPANASNKRVKWQSDNIKVAAVNGSGRVTLKSGGVAVISATTLEGNKVAKCRISIIQKVTAVRLNKNVVVIGKGKRTTLKAAAFPNNANNRKILWRSSNKRIASVNSKGVVKGKNKGSAYIYATAKDGSKKYAKCRVYVDYKRVKKLTLSSSNISVGIGKSKKITANITPKNAVYKKLTWTTSNNNVATVDQRGKITGKEKGTAVITAKTNDGSKKSASCKVSVKKLVTGIKLNKTKIDIEFGGKSVKLKATVTPTDASNKRVKWTSNKPKIVSVNKNGVVKAKGIGNARVTATAVDGSKKSASCKVVSTANIHKELNFEQFNTKSSIEKYCQMFNDYFEDCGAVVNPNLVGSGQYDCGTTSDFLFTGDPPKSIYDRYVEQLALWTGNMADRRCNCFPPDDYDSYFRWQNITNQEELLKFFDELDIYGNSYLETYNPPKILDKKWNGWEWFCNQGKDRGYEDPKSRDNPARINVYVCHEEIEDSGTIIMFYWDYECDLDVWGIEHVD